MNRRAHHRSVSRAKRTIAVLAITVIVLSALAPLRAARAQSSLALTITPPFIQLTINPGEFWASSLKVANTNQNDIDVYATVMNFAASGEEGHGAFSPILPGADANPDSLAQWITVPDGPIHIPREKTGEIPFTIRVPADASPGGHYAAILIGMRPFAPPEHPGTQIQISSFVSALFFVRIGGDVIEQGSIREFSTDQSVYDTPDVDFTVRFENRGNVHIQPQGEVVIYNMWGRERGRYEINQGTDFGNVLPSSTRRFSFTWHSERSLFDIGKYTAVVTLAYGSEGRKNVSRAVSFWIVPIRETATVGGMFLLLAGLLAWGVRRYIRNALRSEMSRRGIDTDRYPEPAAGPPRPPAEAALLPAERSIRRYSILFFVVVPIAILILLWLVFFFNQVLSSDHEFNVEPHPESAATESAIAP